MSYAERTISWTVTKRAPDWFTRTPDRTWTKVACGPTASGVQNDQKGNRITEAWAAPGLLNGSATNDGGRPNIMAYSGGAMDQTRGEFWVTGGGHNAYPGNEPYVLALRASTPAWEPMCNPSPGAYGSSGNTLNGDGQYSEDVGKNGAPQSNHTYNRLVFANERLWMPGLGGQQWGTPNVTSRIFSFDRIERRWRAHGYGMTNAERAAGNFAAFTEETSVVLVPQDNLMWTGWTAYYGPDNNGPAVVVAFDATTGQVVRQIGFNYPTRMGWGGQMCARLISGTRYVLMASSNAWGGGLFLWNAATPEANPVRLTVTDNTGGMGYATYTRGMAWHAASGCAFQTDGNGENLVKLAPNTPGAYTGPWIASIVSPANAADASRVQPSNPFGDPRPYGRLQILDDMGDGRSGLVFQPDTPLQPCFVMPLPIGGWPS